MNYRHHQSAFTIVELIVAISIAGAMMWFINVLFNDTQRAVSLGIATGEALVTSESISNQLEADAALMKVPNATGNGGFLVILNKTYTANMPALTEIRNGILVQLRPGFYQSETIRSDQLIFITDAAANKFRPTTPRNSNNFSNNITADRARVWYGHVTPTKPDGTDFLAVIQTPASNSFGHLWHFGRQALLMDTTVVGGDTYFDTQMRNSGGSGTTLDRALTDVTDWIYYSSTTPAGTVIDTIDMGTYPDNYLNHTYASSRLRCNVAPDVGDFDSWRIAQTHPYLARNVSDFIVEFAADLVDDYNTATGLYSYEGGVPDGVIDNQPDRDSTSGNIIWYSGFNIAGQSTQVPLSSSTAFWNPGYDPYYGGASGNQIPTAPTDYSVNADAAFVFQYDDNDTATSKWPYLIRIRYRLHDDAGRMRSTGDGNVPTSGRWFEHIIKVNRP